MLAAMQALLWINENNGQHASSVENLVQKMHRKLKDISDCAMPKAKKIYKTAVWNEKVDALRKETLKARRALQRERRKRYSDLERERQLYVEYTRPSKELRACIKDTKEKAW